MSQSQYSDAFISVRLVVLDHYMSDPLDGLDPLTSERGYDIRRVPVLRVFGSTPAGQRTTLHLHGLFPYLFVPFPEREAAARDSSGFVYRLSASLDLAINLSLNQSRAAVQHVYKAVRVSGRPFYGYHSRQHTFVKLYFYNPNMVRRAADLLAAGAVMNQVLQPHEAHVPFELQFMMDYNIQGMNLIHLRHAMFRQGQLRDEYDDIEPFFDLKGGTSCSPPPSVSSSFLADSPHGKFCRVAPEERQFHVENLPVGLKLPASILRMATTELEVDAVAADILNCNDLSRGGMNPGLKALWEDERERRALLQCEGSLTPPASPPRPPAANAPTESEVFWLQRYDAMIGEKRQAEDDFKPPEQSSDPDATINIGAGFGSAGVYAAETREEELQLLPDATQLEPHVPTLSESWLDPSQSLSTTPSRRWSKEDEEEEETTLASYLNETIVDEQLIGSQFSLEMGEAEEEEELVELLADLAADNEDLAPAAAEQDDADSESGDSTKDMFSPPVSSLIQARSKSEGSLAVSASQQDDDILAAMPHPSVCPQRSLESAVLDQEEGAAMSPLLVPPITPSISQPNSSRSQPFQVQQRLFPETPLSQRPMGALSSFQRANRTPLSTQRSRRSTTVTRLFATVIDDPETHIENHYSDEEERETLEMSQIVWDTAGQNDAATERSRSTDLNASLWGEDIEQEADFLKQLEW